ncbi:hypothetical protein [uncultured Erythrobacter sp.]|uniref:hypothetical protein n=1 Tax=uncultured Erythrobacter sp. TaxID=263913 RepID=UPI00262F1E68|nr:hypothetical protein [uncultured Erythrobacter sp.]
MTAEKVDLRIWLWGLLAFAIVIALGATLDADTPYGIVDHQAAATAAQVDTIQAAWKQAGLRWLAMIAMAGDLVFIGIYSLGAWRAGRSFARIGNFAVVLIGHQIAIAAVIFCVTDYVETGLQFVQLVQDQGSNWMAGTAAFMQPIKIVAWVASFLGVIIALVVRRISGPHA